MLTGRKTITQLIKPMSDTILYSHSNNCFRNLIYICHFFHLQFDFDISNRMPSGSKKMRSKVKTTFCGQPEGICAYIVSEIISSDLD